MNCAQVKEQLIDFLYDEMPAQARASFADHLRGCPGCSAELASQQKTLAQARAALSGPLLQEPPARVHAAIMEAARAAAKSASTPARRTSEAREDGRASPDSPHRGRWKEPSQGSFTKETPGFFARLWRTPWLLPAFGAVSVATVVFLVRVLKNPEVMPGQRPQSVEEISPAAPEPAAAKAPVVMPAPAEIRAKDEDKMDGLAGLGSASKAKARARGAAKTEASTSVAIPKKKDFSDDFLSEPHRRDSPVGAPAPSRFAEPPPPRAAQPERYRSLDDLSGSVGGKHREEVPAEPLARPSGAKSGPFDTDEGQGFGRPPQMPAADAKKAPAPKAAGETAKPSSNVATRVTSAPAPSAASMPSASPAYAPPPPARHAEMKQAAASAESAAEPAETELAKEKSSAGGGKGGLSLEESVKKADRFFADQNWSAAAVAYRDLLNRFPTHKDAPKWRERMGSALLAEDRARQVKAKASKASKSSDALDGLKD